MDLTELGSLIDLMRRKGVREVSWSGCSVVLGPDPASVDVVAHDMDPDSVERKARAKRQREESRLFRSA